MPEPPITWQMPPSSPAPVEFVQQVVSCLPGITNPKAAYTAQLLWQRGIRDRDLLQGFLNPDHYPPASPFQFAQMTLAMERLQRARQRGEKVAIWGDFDADGITATAVLWEGLGNFFSQAEQLIYTIPNRLIESHGLNIAGLDRLKAAGCTLIVTCDTGSTNQTEIEYANGLGMDVIVTDHHTLSPVPPPVVALINPREFDPDHPLAHLSGVAVAYKLVEALYLTLPEVPLAPLTDLLDLVAIGLIADLVQLRGDCRYLAQRGIAQLQKQLQNPTRPGVAKLLELCRKTGDRPTDISFGLGPRINAVSRIQGDAHFCVELLTSREVDRCNELALETELANTRRKALQKETVTQVRRQLERLDLSTTRAIVLVDSQWPAGILGLVAGQIAQEYGCPTVLLHADDLDDRDGQTLAKGSARSVQQIDLYALFAEQEHLLHRYGGHPLAAGLSLPLANVPLFRQALNHKLGQYPHLETRAGSISIDLVVTVADLIGEGQRPGEDLFQSLKLLEPYGMGNPAPRLMIRNCWVENPWNQNLKDLQGNKLRYIKTEFRLRDETTDQSFPGVWWEHYREELPQGRADIVVELDFNSYANPRRGIQPRYEIRLIAVLPHLANPMPARETEQNWLLDWRTTPHPPAANILQLNSCPDSWDDLRSWLRRAIATHQKLAIAYAPPPQKTPLQVWTELVGLAKYLSRTSQSVTYQQLQDKLNLSFRTLQLGLQALATLGFRLDAAEIPGPGTENSLTETAFKLTYTPATATEAAMNPTQQQFFQTLQEEQFRRQYFYQVPLATLEAIAAQSLHQTEAE